MQHITNLHDQQHAKLKFYLKLFHQYVITINDVIIPSLKPIHVAYMHRH